LLAAWFAAQLIEIAIAGAIIGQGLLVNSLRKLVAAVAVGIVLLFVGTVVMQNTGFAIVG
jgi:hypothetical protein